MDIPAAGIDLEVGTGLAEGTFVAGHLGEGSRFLLGRGRERRCSSQNPARRVVGIRLVERRGGLGHRRRGAGTLGLCIGSTFRFVMGVLAEVVAL